MSRPTLTLIASVARNGAVGRDNALLWRLPEDMQFFRQTTLGHPVIMGRKTWDSLPPRFRPLPGRRNIVISRNAQWHAEGAEAVNSLDAAIGLLDGAALAFVIGGAQIWAEALPIADRLLLTEIDRDYDGDTHFPAWPRDEFKETSRRPNHSGEPNHFDYAFVTYERKR